MVVIQKKSLAYERLLHERSEGVEEECTPNTEEEEESKCGSKEPVQH